MTPSRPGPPSSRPRIGLVLGAGGIRGCAHAGVIAELRAAGVPIDIVVGASIGAMFGLGIAAGLSTERIVATTQQATPRNIARFYLGRLRADRRNPIARLLMDAGAGKTFADLPIPFAVAATHMHTGQVHVFDSGPVLPAVEASIAIPFVARPVVIGEKAYVDGGLLDTAPVYIARAMGADLVIVVCLGFNYSAPLFFRRRPWTKAMLQRLGAQPRPPGPHLRDQIRFGCRLYAATFDPPLPADGADIAIWPKFGSVGPNSIVGSTFCFQQGVNAAREALPQIERLIHSAVQEI